MPEVNIVHTSITAVTVSPEMENFPDPFNVKVYYAIEKQQKLGPFDGSEPKHELPVENKKEPKRVTANASDPYGYKAQCSFAILEGERFITKFIDSLITLVPQSSEVASFSLSASFD